MLVVISFALALASPEPEELFRSRGDIATADVEHSSPVFAAAVGDRDGDGNEDFLLVESYPAHVRIHSGRTLESLREVPIKNALGDASIASATVGRDLDGDGWSELYVWLSSRQPEQGALLRLSLSDGHVVWKTKAPFPHGGFTWRAEVPHLRTPDGEQLAIGTPAVSSAQEYRDHKGEGGGGFLLLDARTGEVRVDRRRQRPSLDTSTGYALAGMGDLDGDGFVDFAVSVPWQPVDAGASGLVEIRSGKDGALLRMFPSVKSDKLGVCQSFGEEVSGVGDVDGDGICDLGVCASRKRESLEQETTHSTYSMQVELHSGRDGKLLATLEMPEWNFSPWGFGHPTVLVPDLDGDGKRDLLLSNPGAGNIGASGAILAYSSAGAPIGEVQGAYDYCVLGFPFAIVKDASDGGVLTVVTACKRAWRVYSVGRLASPTHETPK